MKNEEAKLILQAYRPGGQDASDPGFREALEQAQRDPELARWFAQEQALDSRISAKVRAAMSPPARLKSQLLAQQKILRPVAWWRRPLWRLAGVLSLVLFATLAVVWFKPSGRSEFAQYRTEMAEFAGRKLDRLDLMSADIKKIRQWLTERDAHGDLVLPAGLNGRPSMWCRLLDWHGKKVSLICFELQNHKMAHLLVVDRDAFRKAPAQSPQVAQAGDMATVSWSRGNKTYLIAGERGTEQDLLKLL
jgi:hypothetical protein